MKTPKKNKVRNGMNAYINIFMVHHCTKFYIEQFKCFLMRTESENLFHSVQTKHHLIFQSNDLSLAYIRLHRTLIGAILTKWQRFLS